MTERQARDRPSVGPTAEGSWQASPRASARAHRSCRAGAHHQDRRPKALFFRRRRPGPSWRSGGPAMPRAALRAPPATPTNEEQCGLSGAVSWRGRTAPLGWQQIQRAKRDRILHNLFAQGLARAIKEKSAACFCAAPQNASLVLDLAAAIKRIAQAATSPGQFAFLALNAICPSCFLAWANRIR